MLLLKLEFVSTIYVYENRVDGVIILDSIFTTSYTPTLPLLLSRALRKEVKIS